MSARRLHVALSRRALRDYEDILLYSLRTWGEQQKEAYKATLDRALAALADYPEIGQARNDVRPGYRSRVVGQHAIFYRIESTAIRVNRIVHSRQDIKGQLGEDDESETSAGLRDNTE